MVGSVSVGREPEAVLWMPIHEWSASASGLTVAQFDGAGSQVHRCYCSDQAVPVSCLRSAGLSLSTEVTVSWMLREDASDMRVTQCDTERCRVTGYERE